MNEFLETVGKKIILFDGAMGSLLSSKGLPPGIPPDQWNLDRPDVVKDIHKTYYDAGCDVVITNTLGSTGINLKKYGLEDKVYEINKQAAVLANSVKSEGRFVCGDIGPTGEYFATIEEFDEIKYIEIFREQARGLIDGMVDTIIIETSYDINEVLSAVKGIRNISEEIPIITSMTFNSTQKGFMTMMGVSLEKYVEYAEKNNVDIIGSNCTLDSTQMIMLAERLRSLTKKPVIIQPNAGQPEIEKDEVRYKVTPEGFAEDMEKIIELGINIVGGCCGTTPDHIKLLRKIVDKYNK